MPLILVDNLDAGFSTTGSFSLQTNASAHNPYFGPNFCNFAGGTARWAFTGLAAGVAHRVVLTWGDYGTWTNAAVPWQILDADGATVLASGTVNQQVTPSGLSYCGIAWSVLSAAITPTGTSLTLTLGAADNSSTHWIADAAFCQPASEPPPADTAADGNWSSGATWIGGVVPAAGTLVSIGHAVTLDQAATVGTVGTTDSIEASLVVYNGALTVKAPLTVANGITVQSQKSLTVDATAGAAGIEFVGGPVLPHFSKYVYPYTVPMFGLALEGSTLTVTGTSASRAYIRTQAGNTAKASIWGPYQSYNSGTTVTMSYADLTDLGDATHSSFGPRYLAHRSWTMPNWDSFRAADCVFTRCALHLDMAKNRTATSGLVRTRFVSSVPLTPESGSIFLKLPDWDQSAFTIEGCGFDLDVGYESIGSPTTITDTVFGAVVVPMNGGVANLAGTFARNLLLQGDDTDGMSYIPIPMCNDLMTDCYFLSLYTGPNPHVTSYSGPGLEVDGCILDMPLTYSVIKGMSDSGDTWIADASWTSLTVRRCLFLPLPLDHPRAPGAMPDEHLNMMYMLPTICEHNTSYATYAPEHVSGTRLVEGGENTGMMSPGWLVSVKSNLVYHTLGNLAVVNWVNPAKIADGANASAADLDYNGGLFTNPPAGSANGYATTHLTGPVGAHDVHGDPQFVDPTRSFVTWSRTQRGHNTGTLNGDVAAGLADLVADPTLLPGLYSWVRAGFVPTNPAFQAAHDNTSPTHGWIGAIEGSVPQPPRATSAKPRPYLLPRSKYSSKKSRL